MMGTLEKWNEQPTRSLPPSLLSAAAADSRSRSHRDAFAAPFNSHFRLTLRHGAVFCTSTHSQQSRLSPPIPSLPTRMRRTALHDFSCRSCVPPLALDVASWLGYCNSMINPIIYSFTVKEFKKSALRMVLPLWQLLSRCVPCVPPPPEHFSSRMSRTGQRVRGKSKNRARSIELKSRAAAAAAANRRQNSNNRRLAASKRRQTEPAVFAAIDDDESEEVCCDGLVVEHHSEALGNGTAGGNRVASSNDSHYSLRLYCVTQEASC
uniref:Uncharacterized protein n=1 Tax=Plectus sambesii TaxID=2011161 RepID=A0A914UUA3_9BILA